jgi:hypothetical protein
MELSSNKPEDEVVVPDSSADENISRDSSDIFDTDSSEDDRDAEDNLLNQVREEPTEEPKAEEEEETQREEMGGILVYDAYAKMFGCEKIEKYFEENTP